MSRSHGNPSNWAHNGQGNNNTNNTNNSNNSNNANNNDNDDNTNNPQLQPINWTANDYHTHGHHVGNDNSNQNNPQLQPNPNNDNNHHHPHHHPHGHQYYPPPNPPLVTSQSARNKSVVFVNCNNYGHMHFYAALTTPPNLHAGIEPALLLPGNNLGHAPTVQVAALADGDGDDDDEDDEGADGDEEDGDGDGSSSESSPPPPPFGGDGGGGGGLSGADLGNWHDENATVTLQSVGYDNRGGGGSSNNESGSNLGHVPLNIAMDPRTTNTTAIITMPMATTSTWISTTINPSNPRRRRLTVDSEEDLTAEEISEKRLHRHQRRYQDELRGRSPTRKTRISSVHETMIRNNGKEKKPVSGRHPRQPGAVSISPSALQWKRPRLRSQTPLDSFATSSGTIHQLPPSHAQSTSYQAHLPSSASHLSPNDAIDIDVFGKEQDENNGKLDEEEDKDEATLEKLEG